MQKRVGLARAIAAEPEIIFFDEPTTGLDPIMSRVINDLIREIVVEMGATAITSRMICLLCAQLLIRWLCCMKVKFAGADQSKIWIKARTLSLANSSMVAPMVRSKRYADGNAFQTGSGTGLFIFYKKYLYLEAICALSILRLYAHRARLDVLALLSLLLSLSG